MQTHAWFKGALLGAILVMGGAAGVATGTSEGKEESKAVREAPGLNEPSYSDVLAIWRDYKDYLEGLEPTEWEAEIREIWLDRLEREALDAASATPERPEPNADPAPAERVESKLEARQPVVPVEALSGDAVRNAELVAWMTERRTEAAALIQAIEERRQAETSLLLTLPPQELAAREAALAADRAARRLAPTARRLFD